MSDLRLNITIVVLARTSQEFTKSLCACAILQHTLLWFHAHVQVLQRRGRGLVAERYRKKIPLVSPTLTFLPWLVIAIIYLLYQLNVVVPPDITRFYYRYYLLRIYSIPHDSLNHLDPEETGR